MPARIVGETLPNIPWEDPPPDRDGPLWRSRRNPIIGRYATPTANSVFNSAAVPFESGFAGVFRVDNRRRHMRLHAGFSDDGVDWRIEPESIRWHMDDPHVEYPEYGYDPRVCRIDDRFRITWCNGFHGPSIGLGWTRDFREFHMTENALMPCNRNGVLFPRRIAGRYMLLSRPSDMGHTPFGDIFLSQSDDLVHWGRPRFVLGRREPWESTKIGAGPVPIETTEGWLLFHHGVLTSCNGYVYHFGAVLLDLDEPWRVVARCASYLLAPAEPYELAGDVPNVVFPCAALADSDSGRIALYYGAADTSTCLAFCRVDELVDFVRANPSRGGLWRDD